MTNLPYPHLQKRSDEAAVLLTIMGSEHRLRILRILSEGEITVNSLAKRIGLSQSALSQHLAKLRKAKLVKTRRDAQKVYYYCKSFEVVRVLYVVDSIYDETPGSLAWAS